MEGTGEGVPEEAKKGKEETGIGRVEKRIKRIEDAVTRTDARLETYEEISGAGEEKARREKEEIRRQVEKEISGDTPSPENPADETGEGGDPTPPSTEVEPTVQKSDGWDDDWKD